MFKMETQAGASTFVHHDFKVGCTCVRLSGLLQLRQEGGKQGEGGLQKQRKNQGELEGKNG
jgi:hypothetical protein